MIKKIKELLDSTLGDDSSEQRIIPLDSDLLQEIANEMAPKEPDLRTIGIFTDVEPEKIAELVHALLYLNETNKMEPDPEKHLPIEFYISTYGGSADESQNKTVKLPFLNTNNILSDQNKIISKPLNPKIVSSIVTSSVAKNRHIKLFV